MLYSKASSQCPIADSSIPGKPCTTILRGIIRTVCDEEASVNEHAVGDDVVVVSIRNFYITCAWLLPEL